MFSALLISRNYGPRYGITNSDQSRPSQTLPPKTEQMAKGRPCRVGGVREY